MFRKITLLAVFLLSLVLVSCLGLDDGLSGSSESSSSSFFDEISSSSEALSSSLLISSSSKVIQKPSSSSKKPVSSSLLSSSSQEIVSSSSAEGDVCAIYDWYNDGECDDFCKNPDPDCEVSSSSSTTSSSSSSVFTPILGGLDALTATSMNVGIMYSDEIAGLDLYYSMGVVSGLEYTLNGWDSFTTGSPYSFTGDVLWTVYDDDGSILINSEDFWMSSNSTFTPLGTKIMVKISETASGTFGFMIE